MLRRPPVARVDLDRHRLVPQLAVAAPRGAWSRRRGRCESASRAPTRSRTAGRSTTRVDTLVGELGGSQRPLGPEVGRRVGQEHRHASGQAQGVDHQVTAARCRRPPTAPTPDDQPGQGCRPCRLGPVQIPVRLVGPARARCAPRSPPIEAGSAGILRLDRLAGRPPMRSRGAMPGSPASHRAGPGAVDAGPARRPARASRRATACAR